MESNCSNPSLAIDFETLPKRMDNDTNNNSVTIGSSFSQRPEISLASFSIVDRLDQEVDESYLLPQKFECGDGMQFVNRVFGGDFTSIWEFPWYLYDHKLVLKYATLNELIIHCFSNEYFLI